MLVFRNPRVVLIPEKPVVAAGIGFVRQQKFLVADAFESDDFLRGRACTVIVGQVLDDEETGA